MFLEEGVTEQAIGQMAAKWGISAEMVTLIFVAILIWATVWKLMGLWKSARKGSVIWFIVLAITNTIGILPILYIYVFSKIDWSKFKRKSMKTPKKSAKRPAKKPKRKKK